jgi:hypothetical protein
LTNFTASSIAVSTTGTNKGIILRGNRNERLETVRSLLEEGFVPTEKRLKAVSKDTFIKNWKKLASQKEEKLEEGNQALYHLLITMNNATKGQDHTFRLLAGTKKSFSDKAPICKALKAESLYLYNAWFGCEEKFI